MSEQTNIVNCVITCPSCQAQYNVAEKTLGKDGRQVKCAQCGKAWKAVAEPMEEVGLEVGADDEAVMDAAFEAQDTGELSKSTQSSTNDKAAQRKKIKKNSALKMTAEQKKDMERRRNLLNRTMPKVRANKIVRIIGGVLLASLLLGSFFLRENIVKIFPDMAGVYSNVGLGVNVVGLDFAEVKTLRYLRDGEEVMDISAGIKSVSSRQVSVPRILVTLLDETGNSVFEWSVTSRAAIMLPGEWIEFETQLISPPDEAVSVRLVFEESK